MGTGGTFSGWMDATALCTEASAELRSGPAPAGAQCRLAGNKVKGSQGLPGNLCARRGEDLQSGCA